MHGSYSFNKLQVQVMYDHLGREHVLSMDWGRIT